MTTAFAPTVPVVSPSPDLQGEVASLAGDPISRFVTAGGDLAAKPGGATDSWFITSHLDTPRGKVDLLVHLIQLVLPNGGPSVVQVMASVLDSSTGRYRSEEQDFPADDCSLATDRLDVVTPIATVTGDPDALRVTGTWSRASISCDLVLSQAGPLLANGGTGLWPMLGGLTYHYALPTMTTTGTVTLDGETFDVHGTSWLDRQWATTTRSFADSRWVWFGISLDDGTSLSCWDLIESDRRHRFATIVNPDGGHEVVAMEPTVELASQSWTSPDTGHTYPTHWDVRLPQAGGKLLIAPDVIEQEFRSPNQDSHKYEASAPVTGTLHGHPVTGHATVELVGHWVQPERNSAA